MKLNKYKRYDISKLSNAQIIDLCNDLGENPEYFIRHKDKPMIHYNGAWYVDLYHDKKRKYWGYVALGVLINLVTLIWIV